MANYRDIKNKNVFGGTEGINIPVGTTLQRASVPTVGTLRFNSSEDAAEFYSQAGWASVSPPPSITNVSGVIFENVDSTLTISGSAFKSTSVVSVLGTATGNVARELTTTFVSSTQLTADTNAAAVNYSAGTYLIKVTNPSGDEATYDNNDSVDQTVQWSTSSGSLGTFNYPGQTTGISITLLATDDSGGTMSYSVVSGSLPSGLSLDSATGIISGNATNPTNTTTSPFTVRATNSVYNQTADRAFSITIAVPVEINTTSTTAQTFNVPAGVTSIQAHMWGAGGGGGGTGGPQKTGDGGDGNYIGAVLSVSEGDVIEYRAGSFGGYGYSGTTIASTNNTGGGRGGQGQDATSGGGGGSGGGFSYIKINNSYVLVAGGGGGGGGFDQNNSGGGDTAMAGGSGGWQSGGTAGAGRTTGSGSTGGTQNTGGSGGSGTSSSNAGSAGGALSGGSAGNCTQANGAGGGGGGGGWYGGGGGPGSQGGVADSGGGGGSGGSSYYNSNLASSVATVPTGYANDEATIRGAAGTGGTGGTNGNGTNGQNGRVYMLY